MTKYVYGTIINKIVFVWCLCERWEESQRQMYRDRDARDTKRARIGDCSNVCVR